MKPHCTANLGYGEVSAAQQRMCFVQSALPQVCADRDAGGRLEASR